MSSTKIYGFTTEEYYSYDNTQIQLIGGEARLKLIDYPGRTYQEDYSSDVGFTYDNTKADFSGTQLEQLDQTGSHERFAATFDDDYNLIWSKAGVKTGTPFGTPVVTGGKVVCEGANGVYYVGATSVSESHKFIYTPNYTTTPGANINVWSCWNGINNNDRINISNSPSGNNLRLFLYDSAGTQLEFAVILAPWTPTAGTDYEFEIVIDSAAGTVRMFVDGELKGTETRTAWARGTDATRYYLGADDVIYRIADGSFDNYISFDNVQHTADYTPGYTIEPYRYVESYIESPIATADGAEDGTLVSVETWAMTPGSGAQFTFTSVGGTAFWYNSSNAAWEVSNKTFAQSSTPEDIITYLVDFPFTPATTQFKVGVVFPDNNDAQLYLDSLEVEYTHQIYPANNPVISIANTQRPYADALISFSGNVTEVDGDVKYIMTLDGVKYYWDGAAWVISSGSYTQSNTGTEVADNINTIITTGKYQVGIEIFLHSDDGLVSPAINTIVMVYDEALGLPDRLPVLVDINGYIYGSCCPIADLDILVRAHQTGFNNPNDGIGGGIFHAQKWKTIGTTDSDGYFSGKVYRQTENYFWEIKIVKQRYKFQLPDKNVVDLNELTLTLVED